MKKSIYLSKDREAAIEASGLSLLDIIDRGLAAVELDQAVFPPVLMKGERAARPATCPPHPKGRVLKGYCGRCGRQTGTEKVT